MQQWKTNRPQLWKFGCGEESEDNDVLLGDSVFQGLEVWIWGREWVEGEVGGLKESSTCQAPQEEICIPYLFFLILKRAKDSAMWVVCRKPSE